MHLMRPPILGLDPRDATHEDGLDNLRDITFRCVTGTVGFAGMVGGEVFLSGVKPGTDLAMILADVPDRRCPRPGRGIRARRLGRV